MSYANNKGADQPAHPRSLISAFVVRCLDSVMSLVSVTKIASLMLASVAEQTSLSLTWSETPEDMFIHDEAHKNVHHFRNGRRQLGKNLLNLKLHCDTYDQALTSNFGIISSFLIFSCYFPKLFCFMTLKFHNKTFSKLG